jgi:predicted P-loop ATPase
MGAWAKAPTGYQGIGFVFADSDPFAGIDLDNCIDQSGSFKPWTQPIIARFANTYAEISPSGCGIKIWVKARLEGSGHRVPYEDGAIEIYDRARFFTVTGRAVKDAPLRVEDHQADIEALYAQISKGGGQPRRKKADLNRQIPVAEGERYAYLQSAAAQYRAKGIGYEQILEEISSLNQRLCKPPKPESVLRELAGWAATLEAGKRHVTPDAAIPSATGGNWRDSLILNEDGNPRAVLANAITALRKAPEWTDVLGFNEFSLGTEAHKPPPWPRSRVGSEWTDNDDRLTANWLQHAGIYVSVEIAGQAVQTVARDRPFHPVREYLDSLKWDGTKRIDSWLSLYLGAVPKDYTAAVGERWLVSAVARIYRPGVKADCCLILEGPQGLKKSTALRSIADPWFTDEIADLGTKDAAMQTRGVWIIEIAELDGMSKSDVSKIKGFMSRSTDRFRPPYGKRLIESPRQCVFAGSVNHLTYLRDETGGRRFWPVSCTRVLIDDLERDRDQLWAEAVVQYRAGARWWLDTPELNRQAEGEQADRYEEDPWQELIKAWVDQPSRSDINGRPISPFTATRESVTVTDILNHCIGKRQDQWTQSDMTRVARCLCQLGWKRYRSRVGEKREWRYRRESH